MQRQLKAISATHRLFDIAAGVADGKQKNNDTCHRKDLYTCMALHRGGFDKCDGARYNTETNNDFNTAKTATAAEAAPLPPPPPSLQACGEKMRSAFATPMDCQATLKVLVAKSKEKGSGRGCIRRDEYIKLSASTSEEIAKEESLRVLFQLLDTQSIRGYLTSKNIQMGLYI